uniref:Putative secreted protein n=1 Tax=Anopheles darlingi TaxID=43151 RepID=A0A2M4DJB6_ANODA
MMYRGIARTCVLSGVHVLMFSSFGVWAYSCVNMNRDIRCGTVVGGIIKCRARPGQTRPGSWVIHAQLTQVSFASGSRQVIS